MSYLIEYLGKTYKTNIKKELTEKQYKQIVEDYYRKPEFENVICQMVKLYRGGLKLNYIYNYYIKDIAAKTRLYHSKWSIEEVLKCKELVEVFYGKTQYNKKIYPDSMSISDKITTAFRLCGKGLAEKPANFPIKTCNNILKKYNINNKLYDYSCGWGTRLLSSLCNNIDYYGTDPNYMLCDRLIQMADDFKNAVNINNVVDIRKHGSEIFVSEWENKFGLAFSSPPYYNLEDYKIGNQSYKDGISYEQWINNFLNPTIKNIYNYLISDGSFLINVKNYKAYTLVEDTIAIAKKCGFSFYCKEALKNNKRSGIADSNTNEDILVFKK